jgi:hypothetical protein
VSAPSTDPLPHLIESGTYPSYRWVASGIEGLLLGVPSIWRSSPWAWLTWSFPGDVT